MSCFLVPRNILRIANIKPTSCVQNGIFKELLLWTASGTRNKFLASTVRSYSKTCSPEMQTRAFFTSFLNAKESVTINFIDRVGATRTVQGNIGDTFLDVAKDNDIDGIEGACDGTIACSTCHCIFTEDDFERLGLGDDIIDDELDMLDLAYGLTDTSRLGCQVEIIKEMDGIVASVPTSTYDARDG